MRKAKSKALLRQSIWIPLCAFVTTLGCQTPSPDWNGAWVLNPAKSSYQAKVLTISISADSEYRFDESSSHTIRCDGKHQSIGNNRTLVCVKSGATALDITVMENGVKSRFTHDQLSSDGQAFTTTVTEYRPSGPAVISRITFSRISGSDGFAGKWRDTLYLQEHTDLRLRLDRQALHIEYPDVGQQIDAPLDGVDAAVRGPHVLEGATYAVQPAGSRRFNFETKRHGEAFSQGSFELSSDGRTITETSWNSDRRANKSTLIYEKK